MVRWQEILQRKEAENSAFSLTLSRGVAHGEEKYVWKRLYNWLETVCTCVQLAMHTTFRSRGYSIELRIQGGPAQKGCLPRASGLSKGNTGLIVDFHHCQLVNCRTSMPLGGLLGDPQLSSCLGVKIMYIGPQLKLKTCLPKEQWCGCFEIRMRFE